MIGHLNERHPTEENPNVEPINVVRRKTERRALTEAELNTWMQWRIRLYGEAGLTHREYLAVTYSLHGLPDYAFDETRMNHGHTIDRPTQDYVAGKMRISQSRVSKLLRKADNVMLWFDHAGRSEEIYWKRQGKTGWHLVAPVLGSPKVAETGQVRVVKDHKRQGYRLAFLGDL